MNYKATQNLVETLRHCYKLICDWGYLKILVEEFCKLHLVIVAVKVSDESILYLIVKLLFYLKSMSENNICIYACMGSDILLR